MRWSNLPSGLGWSNTYPYHPYPPLLLLTTGSVWPTPNCIRTRIRINGNNVGTTASPNLFHPKRLRFCVGAANANANANSNGDSREEAFDRELRSVLELATDSELFEIEAILFGPSYFSPLLKSMTNTTTVEDVDRSMIGVDLQQRQQFIAALESRFFFLAADARSTLRGWRPSYRNVLLQLCKKFNIPSSTKFSTQDLELEIFLYLLHHNSSEESGNSPPLLDLGVPSDRHNTLQLGLPHSLAALQFGVQDFRSIMLKGGSVFTLAKIYQLLARKLSGKVLVEAANYQIKKELMKKGGQLAIINLESRTALLAAKQVPDRTVCCVSNFMQFFHRNEY